MSDIMRITPTSEKTMPAAQAMVDMARMFLASQARGDLPRVALSVDGRVTLTWPDGEKASYLTGVDTSSVPARRA